MRILSLWVARRAGACRPKCLHRTATTVCPRFLVATLPMYILSKTRYLWWFRSVLATCDIMATPLVCSKTALHQVALTLGNSWLRCHPKFAILNRRYMASHIKNFAHTCCSSPYTQTNSHSHTNYTVPPLHRQSCTVCSRPHSPLSSPLLSIPVVSDCAIAPPLFYRTVYRKPRKNTIYSFRK